MTVEERRLLEKLASGMLDGRVGDSVTTSGGSSVWKAIKDGQPVMYKQGPDKRFFNGKENERIEGRLNILKKWTTNEEKLLFLRKYGWLMYDSEVVAYSAKYKP